MLSSPTGCCAVQWAMWKGGGALPSVTGLTVQRIICCWASYWPCPYKLSSNWSGSLPLKITVLYQFPTPVPVKLNDGKFSDLQKQDITFKWVELGQETIQSRNEVLAFFCELFGPSKM